MMKRTTSYRLTDECRRLLRLLADYYGGTQTTVIERLVRDAARHEQLTQPQEPTHCPHERHA